MIGKAARREREFLGGAAGSSLIEALLALSILAIALVFMLSAMSTFNKVNSRNQTRSHATAAARARLEELRASDPATLPATGTVTTSATVGLHDFTLQTEYCAIASYCDDKTRHVTVDVQENGRNVFTTETVYTQLR